MTIEELSKLLSNPLAVDAYIGQSTSVMTDSDETTDFANGIIASTSASPTAAVDVTTGVVAETGDAINFRNLTTNTSYQPCEWILFSEVNNSRVRWWDLIILIPNAVFLIFLLLRLRTAIPKLRCTNSPIFLAFYGLVCAVALISVLRCVVSMTVNATMPVGDVTDKVLWLVLRFFLLSTEMSVVVFGLAFGHLDSKTSIRRVLMVTSLIALAYSCTQGALEFKYPDENFSKSEKHDYDIFGHGGMLFLCASSLFFFIVYVTICILPLTSLRDRFPFPSKKMFYYYCGFLSILNLAQAIGSGLLYGGIAHGLCMVDVTAYIYFTAFAPLVYIAFLRDFFASSQSPTILFSYKVQIDDTLDDDNSVSLPHQIYSSSKLEADLDPGSYDSTHFDVSGAGGGPSGIQYGQNPLYNTANHQSGMGTGGSREMRLPVAGNDTSLYSDSDGGTPTRSPTQNSPPSSPDEYAYKPDRVPYTM